MSYTLRRSALVVAAVALAACGRDATSPTAPTDRGVRLPSGPSASVQPSVTVFNTTDLYREINKSSNAGYRIVLAPNTYTLDRTQANGGRLELQPDMSLRGVVGNAGAVVIDASALPPSSYTVDFGTTGAVRVGRGANSLEWLTVQDADSGAAAIETDLTSAVPSRVTIANVVTTGSPRGIDVRSIGTSAAGRVLTVTISNTLSYGNTAGAGQGIRVVNAPGANSAVIQLTLRANTFRNNRIGGLIANNATNYGTIAVTSTDDHFDNNGIGLGLIGGVASAQFNVVSFSSLRTTFENNTATPPPNVPVAGVTVEGGSSSTGGASFNTVSAYLSGARFGNNSVADLRAWGARSTTATVAGTNNVASVIVPGVPNAVIPPPVASDPADPTNSNVVSVVR